MWSTTETVVHVAVLLVNALVCASNLVDGNVAMALFSGGVSAVLAYQFVAYR